MPVTQELYELAIRAIDDYHRDRTVPLAEIRGGLEALRTHINQLIDTIPEEDTDG